MSHELRTPLNAIMGYAELELGSEPTDDELRKNLELIFKTSERAAGLTDQLLAFSRRKMVAPKVTDLNEVMRDTEKMLSRLLGDHIELALDLLPEPGPVKIDPGLMAQAVVNLSINARDAMPDGGKLRIAINAVDLNAQAAADDPQLQPGPHFELVLSDTGSGMDQETLARVFEPFFTTKEPGKGTGLGLSTVHGIVRQSGGQARIASEVGRGTDFTIILPRVAEPVEPLAQQAQRSAKLDGSETILLVEDKADLRLIVRRFLERQGYTVLEASHGGEALQLYERNKGHIHLLITDVIMPKMGGQELADWLAPLRPEMKVLYMSGYMAEEVNRYGLLDSGAAFIQKPFTRDVLLGKVRKLLDGADD